MLQHLCPVPLYTREVDDSFAANAKVSCGYPISCGYACGSDVPGHLRRSRWLWLFFHGFRPVKTPDALRALSVYRMKEIESKMSGLLSFFFGAGASRISKQPRRRLSKDLL